MAKRSGGKPAGATLSKDTVNRQRRTTGGNDDADWVTLRRASEETGVSISTLRSWYRKGLIESRVEKGPNGSQRIVRLDEVSGRARRPASGGPEQRASERNALASELREVIDELAAARERAGRAEARADLLAEELVELRERLSGAGGEDLVALGAENRMLRQRLELMRRQSEEMARRLSAIEGDPEEIDLTDDGEPVVPPEEEDEYLALTQRWRARRIRRKVARREARRARRAGAPIDAS